ncbi:MAG: alpha/beta hydrolase [Polyangiales bacterium]
MLGHEIIGNGPKTIIVLHDWLDDTSAWSGAAVYLDRERYRWVLTDLRGYGRSRDQQGSYTAEEAGADVIALADALEVTRFTIVGHSMSTLVAVYMAQRHPERIERVVLLTPAPPSGFGADDETLQGVWRLARGDDDLRRGWLQKRFGERLSRGWVGHKLARWRAAADPEAVAGYATMYALRGVPEPTKRISAPVLAITGEHDVESMRREPVTRMLAPICEQLKVTPIAEAGHYPMLETPPLLVALLEGFIG